MKIPLSVARSLEEIFAGRTVPASQLKQAVVQQMLDDGVLYQNSIGAGKRVISTRNVEALKSYLSNHFGVQNLEAYIKMHTENDATRADAVLTSGDSKIRAIRTFKGFLVQTLDPVQATLNAQSVIIDPPAGSCWFLQDFESFVPPPEVTIVGIENGETFQQIRAYKHLFSGLNALFVSRYPQSGDLVKWLRMIPNDYLHFGDLDFEGIRIFKHEFECHLRGRSKFFIPAETEDLLQRYGNRRLYSEQASKYKPEQFGTEFANLISLFHRHGKVLEQEGLSLR